MRVPSLKDGSSWHGLGLSFLQESMSYSSLRYWKPFPLKASSGAASEVCLGMQQLQTLARTASDTSRFFPLSTLCLVQGSYLQVTAATSWEVGMDEDPPISLEGETDGMLMSEEEKFLFMS